MKSLKNATIIATVLILCFVQKHSVLAYQEQEEVKKGVVKLTVHQGEAKEVGAGIVLSKISEVLFILTAYHVIDKADSIFVEFYQSPALRMKAQVFQKVDKGKDLAVLYVRNFKDTTTVSHLFLGNITRLKELDELSAIGHPANFEWEITAGNYQDLDPSTHLIRFEGKIDSGNSGGPLLNKNFELIGMVLTEQAQYGFALEINHAIEIVRNWKLPVDFQPPPKGKKWWWIGGGAVATGITAYFVFRNGDDQKNGFSLLPDPPVP